MRLILAAALCAALVLGASAACTKNKNGCMKCDAAGKKCVKCWHFWYDDDGVDGSPAYGLTSAGTCVKCQPQGPNLELRNLVYRCDGNNPKRATECVDYEFGEPVFLRSDGTCDFCSAGPGGELCTACKAGKGVCTSCGGAFLDKATGKCIDCKDENCADCSADPAVCKKCEVFALLIGGVCKDCPQAGLGKDCINCKLKAGKPVCTGCATYEKYGTGLKNGKCVRCEQPNCRDCTTDATKCFDCKWGFRADGKGKCARCPAKCGSCTATKCTECTDGSDPVKGKC